MWTGSKRTLRQIVYFQIAFPFTFKSQKTTLGEINKDNVVNVA